MDINNLPSAEELKIRINSRYSMLQLTSKSELEQERKINKIRKDLQEFIKGSTRMIEKSDQVLIASAMSNILMLGTFIWYKIGSRKNSWFRNLSFRNRTFIRIGIMGTPIFITYYYSYYLNERVSLYIEDKYAERVQQYLITKDPNVINPNN